MATAAQLATILQGLQGFVPTDATAATQYNALLGNLQTQANAQFVQPPAPPAPLRKKLGSPDKFNGNSKEDVDAWIQHMELYMNLSQVPNAERMEYGTYFLRGHAMKWYQSLAIKPTTWTQFCNQIKAQFQPVNPISTARDDLDKLHQTTSVRDYISKFLKISQLITDSTPGELTHGFIRGLKIQVRQQVSVYEREKTLAELMQMAERYDAAYFPGHRKDYTEARSVNQEPHRQHRPPQ